VKARYYRGRGKKKKRGSVVKKKKFKQPRVGKCEQPPIKNTKGLDRGGGAMRGKEFGTSTGKMLVDGRGC